MTDPSVHGMAEQLFLTLLGFSLTPFLLLIALIIIPGTFGVSLGIRKFYINLLLKLFEVRQTGLRNMCSFDLFTCMLYHEAIIPEIEAEPRAELIHKDKSSRMGFHYVDA